MPRSCEWAPGASASRSSAVPSSGSVSSPSTCGYPHPAPSNARFSAELLRPVDHETDDVEAAVLGGAEQPRAELARHVLRGLVVGVHVDVDPLQAVALEAEVAAGGSRLGGVALAPGPAGEAVAELDVRPNALEWDQAAVAQQLTAVGIGHRPEREAVIALVPQH